MLVERRGQVIAVEIGPTGMLGGVRRFSGRRQPSCDGTSRMMREYQVRFCERLGVKFPGPTRQTAPRDLSSSASAPPPITAAARAFSRFGLPPPPRHSRSRASGLRQMLSPPPAPPILCSSGDGPHRVKFWFSFAAGIFQNNRTRSSRNSMPPLKRLISTNNRRAFEHMSRLYD